MLTWLLILEALALPMSCTGARSARNTEIWGVQDKTPATRTAPTLHSHQPKRGSRNKGRHLCSMMLPSSRDTRTQSEGVQQQI